MAKTLPIFKFVSRYPEEVRQSSKLSQISNLNRLNNDFLLGEKVIVIGITIDDFRHNSVSTKVIKIQYQNKISCGELVNL